jgi:iron complex outermembrane receptor protein
LIRLAIFAAIVSVPVASNALAQDDEPLEQVVVSATKLPQSAHTVPGSIDIVDGAQLDKLGAQSFEDYLTLIPGVGFNSGLPGLSTAVIRGISTTTTLDQGQGTTGYFLSEVPLTDPNFAVAIPDIDTFDVDKIAILRGPQGTLFGSASLGGAINYQAAVPDLTAFQARLQGTFATSAHGANSDSGKAMINLPLMPDKLAARIVFIDRNDGGYINNAGSGVRDATGTQIRGGRAELLWTPVAGSRLNYLYLKQKEDVADDPYQEPLLAGPLEKRTFFPERYLFTTTINNLRLDQDLSFATLTATGTYHQKTRTSVADVTTDFGALFGNQLSPIHLADASHANGTTFEVRLASIGSDRISYLVGAMRDLTREHFLDLIGAPGAQQYATTSFDPILGSGFGALATRNDVVATSILAVEGEERAVFGEGTYHFNNYLALTLGGRLFDTKIIGQSSIAGLLEYLATNPSVLSFSYESTERSRGFVPKASLTWNAAHNIMMYALADKGFRFGGPNVNPPSATNPFPPSYAPDSLWNYELGVRTNWFDRSLQWDATAFYIDWSNIQVRLGTPSGLAYATNAGKAASYGLENSASWQPISGFSAQGSLTYLNATLTQPFRSGAIVEPAGAVLPGASRWNVSGTVRYQMLRVQLQPSFQLTDRFISSAPAEFAAGAPLAQGDFNLLDGRVSTIVKGVLATIYVSNIADRRGVTGAVYRTGSTDQYITRPRTIGFTFDYRY